MEDRMMSFPEPAYVEGTIYSGGFPSYKDKDLMQEFHVSDNLEHLVKISRNFEDERLRLLAERIICTKFDGEIPEDIKNRYADLIHERTKTEGAWGSIEKSLQEIEKLIEEKKDTEEQKILIATKEHISSMIK
jgi:exonuclease I